MARSHFTPFPAPPLLAMGPALIQSELILTFNRVLLEAQEHAMVSSALLVTDHLRSNTGSSRVALRMLRWGVSDAYLLTAALLADAVKDRSRSIAAVFYPSKQYEPEPELYGYILSWLGSNYSARVANIIQWTNAEEEPDAEANWLLRDTLLLRIAALLNASDTTLATIKRLGPLRNRGATSLFDVDELARLAGLLKNLDPITLAPEIQAAAYQVEEALDAHSRIQ